MAIEDPTTLSVFACIQRRHSSKIGSGENIPPFGRDGQVSSLGIYQDVPVISIYISKEYSAYDDEIVEYIADQHGEFALHNEFNGIPETGSPSTGVFQT